MIKSVIFFRSEFILQVQPPLRSFLPFQASNVSCVGYQRESTQLRFLKGVVSYYTTTTYIKVCALSILHWLHTYITGHWKLISSIPKNYQYYSSSSGVLQLCGIKSSAKFVVAKRAMNYIKAYLYNKKLIDFFLHLHIFLYMHIFSHRKKPFKFMRETSKNIINHLKFLTTTIFIHIQVRPSSYS